MSKTAIILSIVSVSLVALWAVTTFALDHNTVDVPVVDDATLEPFDDSLNTRYLEDLEKRSNNKIEPQLEL